MNSIFRLIFTLSIVATAASRPSAARECPFITGPMSSSIAASDVDQILGVAESAHLIPWIIEAQAITLDPASVNARVYMIPNIRGPRIRRGVVLECVGQVGEVSKQSRIWTATSKPKDYAQVALSAKGFAEDLSSPPPLEMPFEIQEQFDDDELVSLMQFIRGSPHRAYNLGGPDYKPTGSPLVATGLERVFLVNEGSGVIRVWSEDTTLSGMVYSVSKVQGSWTVSGINRWERYPTANSTQQ